jgi:hypothetical protein
MAPRDSGDDKAETPMEREKGFATLAELRYVYPVIYSTKSLDILFVSIDTD